jgi:uncharacterized protein (TIGR03083 family)
MTSAPDRIRHLIDVWHEEATAVVSLLRSLDEREWSLPTDLPGWDVRAVACHLAHLESELAGRRPHEQVELPPAPHTKGPTGEFTESGLLARASWPTDRIIDELESSAASRYATLEESPPRDPSAPGPGFAAVMGWSWETLLGNRCVDLWMHDQDIRRATDRGGGLDSPAAAWVAEVFTRSLPFVLGKKVGAPAGTTVVLRVTGRHVRELTVAVGSDGRGALLGVPPADPTATLTMDFETWTLLAGGRRPVDAVDVAISGDDQLGRRLLDNLAVTP